MCSMKDKTKKGKSKSAESHRDKSVHRDKSGVHRDKRLYEQILHADSDEVDLESLLEIVNDISDMLGEDERNEKISSSSILNKEKLTKTCVDTAVRRHAEKSFRQTDELIPQRPGTTNSVMSTSSRRNCRSSRSSRSLLDPEPLLFPAGRKNMSFTNDSVREIDRENKRLLHRILNKKPHKELTETKDYIPRPASSAINRLRRQREIDKQNLKFLQRLQSIKPTKSISRNHLLTEHEKKMSREGGRRIIRPGSHKVSSAKSYRRYAMTVFKVDDSDTTKKKKKDASTKDSGGNSRNEFHDDTTKKKKKEKDVSSKDSEGYSMNEFEEEEEGSEGSGDGNRSDASNASSGSAKSVSSKASSHSDKSVSSKASSHSAKSVSSKGSSHSTHSNKSRSSDRSNKSSHSSDRSNKSSHSSDRTKKSSASSVVESVIESRRSSTPPKTDFKFYDDNFYDDK